MNNNYLQQAYEAARAVDPHQTHPNPRVGCVVVKNGEIIATGVHLKKGGDHAEVNALKKLSDEDIKGSTVYVTLEPCDCFKGKQTGSCTQLLIDSGVVKVVIGSEDARFCGKNVQKIEQVGIKVVVEDCHYHKELNPFYDHYFCSKKPFVCAKVACTIDGMISVGTKNEHMSSQKTKKDNRYEIITNNASRKRVHTMRAKYAAILTTTKTIVADNAKLDARIDNVTPAKAGIQPFKYSNPDIIVLGKKEDIPTDHLFWSITDREVHFFDTHDLKSVIDQCGKIGINSIMTEVGPTVLTELLQQDLVDAVQMFQAPKIAGNTKPFVQGAVDMKSFELQSVESLEGDIASYWIKKKKASV